jgi:hypothetical protein
MAAGAMLTRNILFGLNLVSLLGFIAMAIGLNAARMKYAPVPVGFALMGAGTALVFLGLYLGGGFK